MAPMSKDEYQSIPLDENVEAQSGGSKQRTSFTELLRILVLVAVVFIAGFAAGYGWEGVQKLKLSFSPVTTDGLLDQQDFLPEIPMVPMTFQFPTKYEEIGPEADKLWSDMMPLGAGFIRVPYPRRFDMPASKQIEDDPEEGELYSLSITHQLHCLAVLRHVIIKYSEHSKSRFAGDGHEYHCLDYIRQAILCAGDTTLDYAEPIPSADGTVTRLSFTGTNSTHQCRSWEVIQKWAIENRSGDKTGIV